MCFYITTTASIVDFRPEDAFQFFSFHAEQIRSTSGDLELDYDLMRRSDTSNISAPWKGHKALAQPGRAKNYIR